MADRKPKPLDLDDDRRAPARRQPHAGDMWNVVKWVLVVLGGATAAVAFTERNAIHTAAWAGLACFVGIVARMAQAEQHRYPM